MTVYGAVPAILTLSVLALAGLVAALYLWPSDDLG